MKILKQLYWTINLLLIINFNILGQDCPNLNNNNNNPNFNAQVYVFDENGQLIDSVGCSVAGNSGNFNCEGIDDNHSMFI